MKKIVSDLFRPRPDWWQDAQCQGTATLKQMFPSRAQNSRPGKRYCVGCPVKEECLADAVAFEDPETERTRTFGGIYGGLDYRERLMLQAEPNRLIKTCHYKVYKELAGAVRPTQLVMVDGVTRKGRSVLDYSNMLLRDLPDKVFTKQYLKKLGK